MRVLVVEDEVKMVALLRRGLIEEGHLVEVAEDGESAVAMARASAYDVMVARQLVIEQAALDSVKAASTEAVDAEEVVNA